MMNSVINGRFYHEVYGVTGGARGYDVLEALGRLVGDALVQHLPAVRFLGDDGLAVGVLDLRVGRGGRSWKISCSPKSRDNYRFGNLEGVGGGPMTVLDSTKMSVNGSFVRMANRLDLSGLPNL